MYNNNYSTWLNFGEEKLTRCFLTRNRRWRRRTYFCCLFLRLKTAGFWRGCSPDKTDDFCCLLRPGKSPDFDPGGSGKLAKTDSSRSRLLSMRPFSFFKGLRTTLTSKKSSNDLLHLIFRIRPKCWPWENSCRFPVLSLLRQNGIK